MGTCCSEQSGCSPARIPLPMPCLQLASIEGSPLPWKAGRLHGSAFDLHSPTFSGSSSRVRGKEFPHRDITSFNDCFTRCKLHHFEFVIQDCKPCATKDCFFWNPIRIIWLIWNPRCPSCNVSKQ